MDNRKAGEYAPEMTKNMTADHSNLLRRQEKTGVCQHGTICQDWREEAFTAAGIV
jgi:hypothetical protein